MRWVNTKSASYGATAGGVRGGRGASSVVESRESVDSRESLKRRARISSAVVDTWWDKVWLLGGRDPGAAPSWLTCGDMLIRLVLGRCPRLKLTVKSNGASK